MSIDQTRLMISRWNNLNGVTPAWEAFTPTFSFYFRIPGARSTYDVGDDLLADPRRTKSIEFQELPGGIHSTVFPRVVNHFDLGLNIVDFFGLAQRVSGRKNREDLVAPTCYALYT